MRVRRLVAEGLPVGATVTLTCTRHACATQQRTAGPSRRVSFPSLKGRRLRAGTRLRLVVAAAAAAAGAVGAIKRNNLAKQVFCVRPAPDGRRGSCSTLR